ncbi:MAG: hypothetical protein KF817_05020 [Phycisphaeraceae bacterium]|nr:hypothetical protein [Phycisphaeraceae bacterium]
MRGTGYVSSRDPLLAILCVLASLLVPAIASANSAAGAETLAWAFDLQDQVGVKVERSLTFALHQGWAPTYDQLASDSLLAARGGAHSAANAVRLNRQLAAQEIAGGHAFGKHAGEFADLGIQTRQQFASHIENIMNYPSATRALSNGRTAFWDNATGTVVIRNPSAVDGGTAFRPTTGMSYFTDTLK